MIVKTASELHTILKQAESFHGHLGPFLVIGVRIGLVGKRRIDESSLGSAKVKASLPLRVPFSCVVDGIQVSTQCTIGNQRLSLENSEDICIDFHDTGSSKAVSVSLRKSILKRLTHQLAGKSLAASAVRELALEVMTYSDDQLFTVVSK
jgi:formylmethanofuran dehydrogenase subunit E